MPWELTGNSGTDASTNFLGTIDQQPLVIKAGAAAHGREILRVHPPDNNPSLIGYVSVGSGNAAALLTVTANWDGDGLALIGRPAADLNVGLKFREEGNPADPVAALGLASIPNAWMIGTHPKDVILYASPGRVCLGSGPYPTEPQVAICNASNSPSGRGGIWLNGSISFTGDPNVGTGEFLTSERDGAKPNPAGLDLFTDDRPRLSITNSGTVGIGTQTPDSGYALHVHETRADHNGGILAVSETGPGLTAVTQSPNFFALGAENRQGSAINALGSDSDRNSVGVTGRGWTAVMGQSAAGTGVLGVTSSVQSPNITGTGVTGQFMGGGNRQGIGVSAFSANGTGLIVGCDSGTGIFAYCDNGWSGEFTSSNPRGRGVYVSVPAGQPGLQVASGTKSAVVATSQGTRALYSEEATAVWFAEYGFGHLQAGHAVVSIDPLFAETVNLREPYHVFIQLNDGGSEGAAVVNMTDSTFEVVELRNGRSAAEFSYRLVAKRLGHEHHRLEQAPWADNDPNLYPEKRSAWEEQRRLRRPHIPQVEVPPPLGPPQSRG